MTTGRNWQLGRDRRSLTSVRGIAIILVMLCHSAVPHLFGGGPVGVTTFFTLSGFLITSLLLAEREKSGRIQLRAFYGRRARRLLPALVTSVAGMCVVSVVLGPWFLQRGDVLPALFYYANWVQAFPPHDLHALGGTWSLAIEEQFYLVWPLVIVAAAPRGRLPLLVVAGGGALLSLATRLVLWQSGSSFERIYYGSDTVAFGLLIGALLGIWLIKQQNLPSLPLVAMLALAGLVTVSLTSGVFVLFAAVPISAILTTALIWAVARGDVNDAPRWLTQRWLIWFGERSYGLYLWHVGLAWVLRSRTQMPWLEILVIVFVVSMTVAEVSYRLLEQPIRQKRFPFTRVPPLPAERRGSCPPAPDDPCGVDVEDVAV